MKRTTTYTSTDRYFQMDGRVDPLDGTVKVKVERRVDGAIGITVEALDKGTRASIETHIILPDADATRLAGKIVKAVEARPGMAP